jgi:hypothetical protein
MAMIALLMLTFYINSLRWSLLLGLVTKTDSITRGYFYYYTCIGNLSATLFANCIGDIGLRTLSLKLEHKISLLNSSYSVITGQLLNLLILAIMGLPSFLYLSGTVDVLPGVIINLILLMVFFFCLNISYQKILTLLSGLIHIFNRFSNRFLTFIKTPFSSNITSELLKTDKKSANKLILQSLAIYFFLMLYHLILARALHLNLSTSVFLLAFPVAYIISAIGITPGGLGITELGWFGILTFLGVSSEQATVFVVAQRIIGSLSVLFASLFAFPFYHYNLSSQVNGEQNCVTGNTIEPDYN